MTVKRFPIRLAVWARHLLNADRGASAVEFALVAPLFLLLLFGTVEFSRLLWTRHALQQASAATARCMGIPQTQCTKNGIYDADEATAFSQAVLRGWAIAASASTIKLDHDAHCAGISGFSSVTISHEFDTAVPEIMVALAGGATITASACFPNQ